MSSLTCSKIISALTIALAVLGIADAVVVPSSAAPMLRVSQSIEEAAIVIRGANHYPAHAGHGMLRDMTAAALDAASMIGWTAEAKERRFDTNLLEEKFVQTRVGDGWEQEWQWINVESKPWDYTEFILPELPDKPVEDWETSNPIRQSQASTVTVYLDPAASSVIADETFTMAIKIATGAQEVDSAETFVDFDATYLEVIEVARGDIPDEVYNAFDNVAGEIDYAGGDMSGTLSGTFTLATITFQAMIETVGTKTPLSFHTIPPRDTRVILGETTISSTLSGGEVVIAPRCDVYLPLVLHHWPPMLDTPTLYDIDNDGVGSYTVSWSTSDLTRSYVLEEAAKATQPTDDDFTEIYIGLDPTYPITGRGAARYHYRVKARNAQGDSDWSNVEWADVLWEAEPNDDAITQANGPIVSGLTYHGTFPSAADLKDYFYFDLPATHTVEIWLTDILPGHNYDLTLRDTSLEVVGHSGELDNANEHILISALQPGRYYIHVSNYSKTGSTQPYHLQVVYQ